MRRPSRRSPGACGSTIAVRSLRSGLPRRHLRCRLRRLPSDSLRLIDAPRAPGRQPDGLWWLQFHRRRGESCTCVLVNNFEWWRILRGPLPAGRAGGLWELTHRLASWFVSLRVWVAVLAFCSGFVWGWKTLRGRPLSAARAASGTWRCLAICDAATRR